MGIRTDHFTEPTRKIPLKEAIASAPKTPGAYRFWDDKDHVLYVGKAKNLKNRIRTHLTAPDTDRRHGLWLKRAASVDWIIVPDEREALVLEDVLIKRHKPEYNIRFRDDKRYPLIRLSVHEDYPALSVVRRYADDGARYFGPYVSARSMRVLLRLIERHFPLRRCSGTGFKSRGCLNYQMHRCSGACIGAISKETYVDMVRQVQLLLEGRCDELIHHLQKSMRDHADALRFEAAARLRDQLSAVQYVSRSRKLLLSKPQDLDVIAVARQETSASAEILFIRQGVIAGNTHIRIEVPAYTSVNEISERILIHSYRENMPVPREILVSSLPVNLQTLSDLLRDIARHRVVIRKPQRGIKARLVETAAKNLLSRFDPDLKSDAIHHDELEELKMHLDLPGLPVRVEAVDASEAGGKYAVGSIVSFYNGQPDKKKYKHFKIKDPSVRDDTHRIREILERRFRRAREEGWELPDLLIIDGGRNQLNAALDALRSAGIERLPVISVAKQRNRRSAEGIFLTDGRELQFASDSTVLRVIDRIRDEAHRFAIKYHRKLRAKASMRRGEKPPAHEKPI